MTVSVCVNMSKQIGDKDHVKVANVDAAEKWFENDSEGVAFACEVLK